MANARTAANTRWAGVPAARRRDERRDMLVRAAYRLFAAGGEAALAVRAVCREAELHTRYFYENFADTAELLAAVYDQQATALGVVLARAVEDAGPRPGARTRAGIRAVLRFISDDPGRGRVLFAEARGNEILAARRRAAQTALLEGVLAMTRDQDPPLPVVIAATMFTGAMTELAQQWADGRLGTDLDAVVDGAVNLSLALHRAV
ncbi:TetR/AcrR family transcriptional regulator [Actinomadura montaniterrae]|uniref:TetR/AcrR family transcriptional regulator n=1 Tax=Actinomadura montaniterrae TaxID=1803903 RepID=A0A6L3VY63_9ACTN|nr:TetR/AcrR family transcriptional regulator [Actinomadura montaniterrae]KAB2380369.1 TetR/AcrR family transcriptional regulator [Actinomadura montaniterrae]